MERRSPNLGSGITVAYRHLLLGSDTNMNLSSEEKRTALQKRIAALVFPRHSTVLERVNANALVWQWIRASADVPTYPNRFDMYDGIIDRVIGDAPIDYVEFGVWKGESIQRWASLNKHPDSRFWGFDSFVGLPERWEGVREAGAFDVGGEIPQIDDPRVSFVKGWFQDTLPTFLRETTPRSRLVVHHDSDLYSSVLYCLTMMNSFMTPGTILIFDEFSSPLHEFRALSDYTASYRRSVKAIGQTALFAQQAAFTIE